MQTVQPMFKGIGERDIVPFTTRFILFLAFSYHSKKESVMAPSFHIGFLVFPMLTQLDMTGPYEVFNRMPGAEVDLIWKHLEPVESEHGLPIQPTATFETCPDLDLICVPGGFGVNALLNDAETLAFLRRQAANVQYVTSVCTGSLVLGAAGLLKGKRAACHWLSRNLLRDLGAEPADERVVVDGNTITGGGVTAGIDFALSVTAEIAGPEVAQTIQLMIEYNPAPPFDAGSPDSAPQSVVDNLKRTLAARQEERGSLVAQAALSLA